MSRTRPADATELLAETLRDSTGSAGLVRVVIPAPPAPAEPLMAGRDDAFFWTTPGAPIQVGLGIARSLHATGEGRFERIRTESAALFASIATTRAPGLDDVPPPRLYGGFAFLPGAPSPEWARFGDATFVLPRLLYTRHDGRASLALTVDGERLDDAAIDAALRDVERLLERLRSGAADPPPSAGPRQAVETAAPSTPADRAGSAEDDEGPAAGARARWCRDVASIQRRIEEGRAAKIVAARRQSVRLEAPASVPEVLRRLDRESSTAARFAFRLGGTTFLGATPEQLVSRSGRTVRTEALAGSVPADRPEEEARLVASVKEEAEHGYVVEAIAAALGPWCEELRYPSSPRVQRLLHVLHLQTPFEGRLRRGVHVLELVERLHPTPAVGGLPTHEAMGWIAREEPGSRGWYAAPVGWFDAAGDGEFGVALRSGLLEDDRAHLYAGAGIVAGSDAAAEFAETEVKLRTMLTALGRAP